MPSHPDHNWDNDRFLLAVIVALALLTTFIALVHLGSA